MPHENKKWGAGAILKLNCCKTARVPELKKCKEKEALSEGGNLNKLWDLRRKVCTTTNRTDTKISREEKEKRKLYPGGKMIAQKVQS